MISVIIPTRNRAGTLQRTLYSLHQHGAAAIFEVIVVDNGSTDRTKEICDSFTNRFAHFTYVYDAEPGLLTGRHAGAARAQGELLCFLDDDVEINAGWFKAVTEVFKDESVQLATGPSLPLFKSEPPPWLAQFWDKLPNGRACGWLSLIDLGPKQQDIHPNFVWGLNFCIRKKALITLGGFHPDNIPPELQAYQGDGETGLTQKAFDYGYRAVYQPGISLHHIIGPERLTEQYFKKRAFYQGVCNSFTLLRQLHAVPPSSISLPVKLSAGMQVHNLLSSVKNRLLPSPQQKMKKMLMQEEQKGFQFHHRLFKEDDRVRNWVLKENYWNYKLPV